MQTAATLQAFAVTWVSHRLIVFIFCSCAPDQWQPVQLGARASLRQTDRFRVLGRLGGPFRVQSGLPAERIQCHPLPGHAGCPRAVERNSTKLHRYGFRRQMHNKGHCQSFSKNKTKLTMALTQNPFAIKLTVHLHEILLPRELWGFLLLLSVATVIYHLNYPKLGFNIPTCLLAV